MFSYKTTIDLKFRKVRTTTSSPLPISYIKINKKVIKYSPFEISSISTNERKHTISIPELASRKSFFHQNNPLFTLKKKIQVKSEIPIMHFNLSLDIQSHKPSIMQTVENFKASIERKYTNIYKGIISNNSKAAEIHDIVNFIRIKKITNELGLAPWQNESEMLNKENLLAKTIMEIFDIDCDGILNLEEFLSACSVYEIYFSGIPFNFFNVAMLLKLKSKIEALRLNFSRYTKNNIINSEYLLNVVQNFNIMKERRSFIGYIKTAKFDFKAYLRILPVFLHLENSKS